MNLSSVITSAAFVLLILSPPPLKAQKGTHRAPIQTEKTVQRLFGGDERVVVETELVTINATVMDARGRLIEGLSKDNFRLYEDEVPQQISFFTEADEPASVAVVFDLSASMSEGKLASAKEALAKFIQTSHENDQYTLISFNDKAQMLLDKNRDAKAVVRKLTYVQPQGQTALYDAVYLGIEKAVRGDHRKRAILLITDGQDNYSRYSFGELRKRLQESDVSLYSIGLRDGFLRTREDLAGEENLTKLSDLTGGHAFFPVNGAQMNDAFARIAVALRRQYQVSYRPTNNNKQGEWRRVKVKVSAPEQTDKKIIVRAREGYFAPVEVKTIE